MLNKKGNRRNGYYSKKESDVVTKKSQIHFGDQSMRFLDKIPVDFVKFAFYKVQNICKIKTIC